MARKRKDQEEQKIFSLNGGGLGYSQKGLDALIAGKYDQVTGRDPKYRTSQEQLEQSRSLPVLKSIEPPKSSVNNDWQSSFGRRNSVDTMGARQKYANRIGYEPLGTVANNDESYVVKRDRYNKLMQNGRLANDIKTLAEVNYKNANRDATVSQEWADTYGAKNITGGYTKDQFIKMLGRRYDLTPKELEDMALTFHTDSVKTENENLGKSLKDFGEKHPVVGSLGSFVGTLGSGVEGLYNAAAGAISDDDRFLSNMFSTVKNSPREGARKNIKTQGGNNAYDVAMGLGDFGTAVASGGLPFITGGNTANEIIQDAVKKGKDVRKSSVYGGTLGTARGIVDALTMGAGSTAVNAGKNFFTKAAIAGGKAGALGLGEQAFNELADALIMGNEGTYAEDVAQYMRQGLSEEEAGKRAMGNIVLRGGESALTRAALGAGISLVGSAAQGFKQSLRDLAYRIKMDRYVVDPDDPIFNEPIIDLDDLNEYYTRNENVLEGQTIPRLTGSVESTSALPGGNLPALPDNIYPIQMPGTNGVINLPGESAPIQLPDLSAKSSPIKYAAERAKDSVIRSKPILPSMIGKGKTSANKGYKVGDNVTYVDNGFEGAGQLPAVVKEVAKDHIVLDVPGLSDHVWLDNDMMDMVRPTDVPTSTGASVPALEIEDSDFAKGVANAAPDNSFSRMTALLNQVQNKVPAETTNASIHTLPQSAMNGTKDDIQKGKLTQLSHDTESILPRTPEANSLSLSSDLNISRSEENVNNEAQSYWLRVLGDDEYAAQESERYGMTPEDYRGIAAKSLGIEVPPTNGGNEPPKEPNMKTSQTYTNTGKNGGGWTEEEYAQYTDPSQFQYESIDEQESVNRAIDMRTKEGREGFKNRMMKAQKASGAEIDGLMMEWRQLGAEARALETAGQDASALRSEAIRVFRKVQELSTESAQGLQALAKWSRNTPEGMLSRAEHIANGRIKKDGSTEKSAVQKTLDKVQKNKKDFKFSDEFVNDFLARAEEVLQLPSDSRELKVELAKLGKEVSAQIPVKLSEKVTAFLMDNMLGNFRTLISRNAGGNVGLNAVEQLIQRPLAAGIDSIVSRKTGVRTQSGLTRQGLADYMKGFKQGISEEMDDFKKGLHTARSGEVTLENAINSNRHVFKTKLFDGMDNLVKTGLSLGDRPFYEAVYSQTLGDYYRLRDMGKMGDVLNNLSDSDFDEFAKAAAKMNALAAVYQKDSLLSNALMGIKNSVGDLSRGILGVDVLSQFSMPFVKTPAGVVDVAIDYSPIGLVRNSIRTGKEIHNKEFDQNRFANESARNILGTLGMTAGAGAAAAGILGKGYSEDKDEKNAQKAAGEQEYALNIGDNGELDISWVPVLGSNAVASAATVDAYKKAKEKGDTGFVPALMKGLEAGGESLLQQAVFQGMQKLFGGDSYNSDKGIVGNMVDTVKSGVGQGIPSLVRQTAQTLDPYTRDLVNSNPDLSFGSWDNYDINSYISNIPILRNMMLAPKVGTNGELIKANDGRNIVSRAFENMILPGKVSEVNYNALDQEATRLKELTTSSDAFMPLAKRDNVDTADHTLSNKEWTEFQQNYYGTMTEVGTKLMDTSFYKESAPTEQVKILKSAYDGIKYALQSEYNGKEVDGAAKRYLDAGGGEKGVQAVVDYCTNNAIKSDIESKTGLSGQSKANESIQKEIKAGNKEKAEEMVDAATRLSQLGLTKPGPVEAYYTAQRNGKNVNPDEFAKTFKAIDADGNQGVKQQEVIDYLNNNSIPKLKGEEIYSIYAPAGKKKAKLKDGTWYLSK